MADEEVKFKSSASGSRKKLKQLPSRKSVPPRFNVLTRLKKTDGEALTGPWAPNGREVANSSVFDTSQRTPNPLSVFNGLNPNGDWTLSSLIFRSEGPVNWKVGRCNHRNSRAFDDGDDYDRRVVHRVIRAVKKPSGGTKILRFSGLQVLKFVAFPSVLSYKSIE